MGAKVQPSPTPARISGGRKVNWPALRDDTQMTRPMPTLKQLSPASRTYVPPNRAVARRAMGAMTIEVSDIGAKVRPAFNALKPSTDCRKIVSGKNRPIMPKKTMAASALPIAKFRSLKSDNGTSGSSRPRSHRIKSTNRMTLATKRLRNAEETPVTAGRVERERVGEGAPVV